MSSHVLDVENIGLSKELLLKTGNALEQAAKIIYAHFPKNLESVLLCV